MSGSVKRHFSLGSDNHSGMSPEIFDYMKEANCSHAVAYGDDEWTRKAKQAVQEFFDAEVDVYFTLTGTGANLVGLGTLVSGYSGIFCTDVSHIHVDECAAPERFLSAKLITIPHQEGKLTPESMETYLSYKGCEHHVQPEVISITQATELGTLYQREELIRLREFKEQNGLFLYVDGARLSNALVSMNLSPAEFLALSGADVISFGGTKNGLMLGEALVFSNHDSSARAKFLRKQCSQLASKMRFLSAQFLGFLERGLWERNARHSNQMARVLAEGAAAIEGIKLAYPVESNAVFVHLPPQANERLWEMGYFYHLWSADDQVVRWMTSFDTSEENIAAFVRDLRSVMNSL